MLCTPAPVCVPVLDGRRISSIAAMCSEGFVDYHLTNGTVNGEFFLILSEVN